jgi:hypothetical protein
MTWEVELRTNTTGKVQSFDGNRTSVKAGKAELTYFAPDGYTTVMDRDGVLAAIKNPRGRQTQCFSLNPQLNVTTFWDEGLSVFGAEQIVKSWAPAAKMQSAMDRAHADFIGPD